ncbi:hydantoinase B/oxoprolinase family protein [Conexibacter woesei]|uniref:5-oxoprolinase (ATP-hydrolyzing) n=1 Tax=Conexibacter woesei (strain DSM 14684 / CCUG 47730 / CIP 108061 / JCM 11494 / NBRC 100937 / ID131577) TaxID=469383 RepID=D3F5G8_CONWI|nr:hydantoinase B/oxoprolinase family protein [Conexibacter woesei]ADB50635.1 5-oxoprolinase (ATP-hydrolyzing) [Conexibacter woesei DSM 14684]
MTTQPATTTFDVFTVEIIRNAFASIALEMNRTLRRTAHNPLLYEVQDFGVGIVSADAELWGDAPGQSLFVGALSETVATALERHGADGFADGDVLICNDPFSTGTHISDTSVYVPIVWEGELVAFAMTTAHWADIGGKSPGGWCPDSTDTYQEGLCFVHQHLVRAGTPTELIDVIRHNVRVPAVVLGDLDAQIAACRLGAARTLALCERHGSGGVRDAMRAVIARTEAAIREQIRALPDGTYRAEVAMDHDGVVKDVHPCVRLQATIAGDELRVSFEGSDAATRGPVNVPAIGTRAAVRVVAKALLAPRDNTNEGHFRALAFDLPGGLVVSAERPSPTDSYGYVVTAIEELAFRALAQVLPERAPAGGFPLVGVLLARVDPRDGAPFVLIDGMGGGNGAGAASDGPSIMLFANGDVTNTPVEVCESRYPVRVRRFAVDPASAGAGRFRGGAGLVREYELLEDGIFLQTVTENSVDPLGKGLFGGGTGATGGIVVNPGRPAEDVLHERVTYYGPLGAGDVVTAQTGGGGGWGPPHERDPETVAADVRDDRVSADEAAATYRVAVVPGERGEQEVDERATARLRGAAG